MNFEIQYDEKLTLLYLYKIVKKYKRSFIISPALMLLSLLTFEFVFVAPVYEAVATIQIGQVNGKQIESSNALTARMKDYYFIPDLITSNPDLFVDKKLVGLIRDGFSQKPVGDELVSFSLRSSSREHALLVSEAVFNRVKVLHKNIFDRNNHDYIQNLNNLESQIDSIQKDALKSRHFTQSLDSRSYDIAFQLSRENQMKDLIAMKLALEATQAPAITYETRLFSKVYVSTEPISSNLILLSCAALFFGVMAAFLTALFRENLLIKDF